MDANKKANEKKRVKDCRRRDFLHHSRANGMYIAMIQLKASMEIKTDAVVAAIPALVISGGMQTVDSVLGLPHGQNARCEASPFVLICTTVEEGASFFSLNLSAFALRSVFKPATLGVQ
jgi:hypothetical protein